MASSTQPSTPEVSVEESRFTFNEIYECIEQEIRSFSKQKIMYEQIINDLKAQTEQAQQSFENLNLEHQSVIADNKKLVSLFESNEDTRLALQTLLAAVERKQEIICDALEHFEKTEADIFSRYEAHEDFIYCLKFRQNQLLKWVEESKRENETLNVEVTKLKAKCDALINELTKTNHQMEENLSLYAQEETALINSHNNMLATMNKELQASCGELKREQALRESLQVTMQELQAKSEAIYQELNECKIQIEEKTRASEEERITMTNELQKLKNQLEEMLSTNVEEKSTIIAQSKESLDKLDKELQVCQTELQNEKTNREAVQVSLQELQVKCESLEEQINENKRILEEKTKIYEEEKIVLTNELQFIKAQMEETISTFNEENTVWTAKCESLVTDLDAAKSAMEEQSSSFKSEKEDLSDNHKQAIDNLTKEFNDCKTELRALYQRYQEQKQGIAKLALEEGGVRPVILPSKDKNKSSARIPPTTPSFLDLSQTPRKYVFATPKVPTTPATPGRFRIHESTEVQDSNKPELISTRGILKRPKDDNLSEKTRNVSFGSTTVLDFNVSSTSDSESASSGEVYEPGKGKTMASSKRVKLSDEGKNDVVIEIPDEVLGTVDDKIESSKEPAQPKQRRFRGRISVQKKPIGTKNQTLKYVP